MISLRFQYLITMLAFLIVYSGCGSGKEVTEGPLTREQQNIRAQLFENIDDTLEQAKAIDAQLYSPTNFETGMRHYNNAEQLLRQERNIENIRTELNRAEEAFKKAMETARLGAVTFSTTVAARNDALKADAPTFGSENWNKAEATFRTAAEALEAGNVNRARQEAQTAENQYRAVELESIKANHLNTARELLQQADAQRADRNVPRRLEKARSLVQQAETLLMQDRYDTEEANRVSREAAYTAAHALYLNQKIVRLRNERRELEDILLEAEEPVEKIAEAANLDVRFDEGFDGPVQEIITKIKEYEDREQTYVERIREQENELALLRRQVDEKGDLAELLEMQRMRDEAINKVINLFNPDEGNVLLDGNNILIRLYGLSFSVGRSVIEPQYFALLTRVQDAIKQFPNGKVIIEGHTDSRGSLELNQRLSDERAESVAEYIRANIGIPLDITSIGYGPNRPVASNETEEGRSMNRRIDVVITPDWVITSR